MVEHAGSRQRTNSARLIYLAVALLALGAIVPACSCGEQPIAPVVDPGDVGLDVPSDDEDVTGEEDITVEDDVPEVIVPQY